MEKGIFRLVPIFFLFFLLSSSVCRAVTYTVSKNCGGISNCFTTIQAATDTANAGDTVLVRSGIYQGNLIPKNSGNSDNYIIFAAYPNESVTITHNPAQEESVVNLRGKSYIIIDGFTLDGNWTGGWVEGYSGGDYNIIRSNTMLNCNRDRAGILITQGTHWKIQNNTMAHSQPNTTGGKGTDAITLRSTSFNLIEGNIITNAEHATILAGGSNEVIRNNKLSNIYNQVVNSGSVTGDTKILWENNVLVGGGLAQLPRDTGLAQGIQMNSQQTIIRHNIIYNAYSSGLELSAYWPDGEAWDVKGNRIYNNVMYGNNDAGIRIARYTNTDLQPAVMSDNIFKNNIIRKNIYGQSTAKPQQLYFLDYGTGMGNFDYLVNANIFSYNDFSTTTVGGSIIGGDSNTGPTVTNTLVWFQTNYPLRVLNNLETDPKFINENGYDFHLAANSPLIDAGTPLTTTVGTGSGSKLTVSDAKYFSDGFGVVNADWIKIGNSNPVQISTIDYTNKTITLTSSTSWNNGDTVNLYKDSSGNVVFVGSAPDIGAYEYIASCLNKSHGDANCDGVINILDFEIWRREFLNQTGSTSDFDGNGTVNIIDFEVWRRGFLSQ